MKRYIKQLFFDEEMVSQINQAKFSKEELYNHLFIGRITLQEYLAAEKKLK